MIGEMPSIERFEEAGGERGERIAVIGVGVTLSRRLRSLPLSASHVSTSRPAAVTNERAARLYSPPASGFGSVSEASSSSGPWTRRQARRECHVHAQAHACDTHAQAHAHVHVCMSCVHVCMCACAEVCKQTCACHVYI